MSESSKRLFLVDGHAHIYAAYYAPMRPLTSPSGEPTKAVYVFITTLLSLIEREKPEYLAVAMDSKTPSFRVKVYPEYKANRPPMPEDMPSQILRIEQILEAMRIPVIRVEGYEADDVIGTLAAQASKAGMETWICSKDKDMLQLLDERTFTYDIKTGQRYDLKKMLEELHLTPQQFIDVLALQGDTSDNIPGVPDVGPKTALQWIQKYGSLENLYAHADEIEGKRGENLRKFKDQVFLSRQLVIIDRNVPIQFDKKAFALGQPDWEKLARIFTELGFTRLLNQFNLKPVAEEKKPDIPETLFPEDRQERTLQTPQGRNYVLVDTAEELNRFLDLLDRQERFSFDTETTSLDAMRAELVGLSFSWQAGQGWYLPVRAPIGQKHLSLEKVRKKLAPILGDPSRYKIAQNMKYDMIVLENSGLPVKLKDRCCFDTMVASYVLASDRSSHSLDTMARDYLGIEKTPISSLIGKGKKQISFDQVDTQSACLYSAEDADVTWQLWEYLSARLKAEPPLQTLFETLEMPLVEVLMRMEMNGVFLDVSKLRKMSETMARMQEELRQRIYALAGGPFNIDSTKQLGEVLFDRLGLQSIKIGKTQRSTDADVLEQLSGEHEIVPLIIQYRQIEKLRNTYTEKLVQLINPKTGRVHASFNQTVTVTGRLSSSDPNLQNIPVRTELGRQIRSAFVPEKKTDCILSADYSQIELRLLAHFSGDAALRKAFAEDRDIHSFVASQIYGVPIEQVTPEMRTKAKAVNFGIIYGQGPYGLARTAGISQAEAKRFIEDYFRRYQSIRAFMDRVVEQARQNGYAETILHRRRKITGLESRNPTVRSQARRLAINTVIQGSAADLIKAAMIRIHRRIDKNNLPIKMILQIHDELVFELPKSQAEEHKRWIVQEMTQAVPLEVPLKVDTAIGSSWLAEEG
ncbi:MAG TPA: DNA polymerase I [Anaerohalosphaeraceae bacterium]|nr:DNA polymerase I [Anaerohalosphaeraceae bacterium]HRT22633.1 DNA polymerase I [Anaerohalosphaeraceae bacterium]HRU14461.1 DNA polymerase I [Anaerohalosphaeraceae bacterium]